MDKRREQYKIPSLSSIQAHLASPAALTSLNPAACRFVDGCTRIRSSSTAALIVVPH